MPLLNRIVSSPVLVLVAVLILAGLVETIQARSIRAGVREIGLLLVTIIFVGGACLAAFLILTSPWAAALR